MDLPIEEGTSKLRYITDILQGMIDNSGDFIDVRVDQKAKDELRKIIYLAEYVLTKA